MSSRKSHIPFPKNGRGQCRWCDKPIVHLQGKKKGQPDRRRSWHPECVEEWRKTSTTDMKVLILERDKGVCKDCGVDTLELATHATRLNQEGASAHYNYSPYRKPGTVGHRGYGSPGSEHIRTLGYRPNSCLWEMDHIVELVDGGENHLDNCQTLCQVCHKAKTARSRRERARKATIPQ